MQRLMPDSTFRNAERIVQPPFSKSSTFSGLALAALIMLGQWWLRHHRPALDLSIAAATVEWIPAPIAPIEDSRLRLAGAWALKTSDSRIGGISGMAMDGEKLLVLTDGGMIARLPLPPAAGTATLRPLPAVSGNPRTKIGRDSEALMRDPSGRGWWVAFEQRHQLIRYDSNFRMALERIDIVEPYFRKNRGVEALSLEGGIRWYSESSGISDAASIVGQTFLLRRRFGLAGFSARVLRSGGDTFALPIGPLDNAEGLAAESLPDGRTRLWIVTDNDFRPWRRTLVMAVDLAADDQH